MPTPNPERTGMRWPSPAKLNLFLHVTGQRKDGYHTLQTLFQLLDYGDELEIIPSDSGVVSLECNEPALQSDDNLILKAAQALRTCSTAKSQADQLGARIKLHKRLPIGGGIGGGSSNAATTLVALNHHWRLGLSVDDLAQLGLSLGADVPVFVRGRTALAEGIGEQLTPIQTPDFWYLVVFPQCFVSTPKIFSDPALTRDSKAIKIRALDRGDPLPGRNDMQPVVVSHYPPVKEALEWLASHAPSRMSGSGGCVYAVFDNEEKARKIAASCRRDWQTFVAKGVQVSPLIQKLTQVQQMA